MKKEILAILIIFMIFPIISAVNLNVQKISSNEALIINYDKPSPVDLKITNNGDSDTFLFYSFFAGGMYPRSTILLNGYETKDVQVGVYPRDNMETRGLVNFNYFIKGKTGEQKENLIMRVIELKNSFEIGTGAISDDRSTMKIYVKNLYNYNFENVHAKFSSPFFSFEKDLSIKPHETKEFDAPINKEDFKKLLAGSYKIEAELNIDGKIANLEGVIKFEEKNLVVSTERKFGFVINTFAIKKENDGNVITNAETVVTKNIISRLFTTFNVQPDSVERQGAAVYYTWLKDLSPGDALNVVVKTNWIFPLLIIIFIIAIVALAKLYTKTSLILRKRVNFVRAKGGEFALKVSITVHARKFIEKVSVTDRLPPLVKLHEKFGPETPKRVDEKNRKIEWNFPKLQAGETRVLSYLIYSRVGVVGRFALPKATAIYDKEGTIHEEESNQAFFVAEQKMPKD